MRPILHRTCWSLQAAFYGRRPQANPLDPCLNIPKPHQGLKSTMQRRYAVTEWKGDWEWHAQLWELRTCWKNRELCHLCRASKTARSGVPFVLFGADKFIRRSHAEFVVQSLPASPCPLLLTPGFHPGQIRYCAMHVLALGVYQTLCAEAILWMAEHRAFSAYSDIQAEHHAFSAFINIHGARDDHDQLEKQLRCAFQNFKTWLSVNKLSCSGRCFNSKRLHVSEVDFPWLGYKAFNCRIVLAWAADAWLISFCFSQPAAPTYNSPLIRSGSIDHMIRPRSATCALSTRSASAGMESRMMRSKLAAT